MYEICETLNEYCIDEADRAGVNEILKYYEK